MSSGFEGIMISALVRMKAATPVIPAVANIRRAHRTNVPRESTPAVHLIEGIDEPVRSKHCGEREGSFTVSIFGRSDAGVAAVDSIKVAIMAKMEAPWASGVVCYPGAINHDVEIADADVIRVDMEFKVKYPTQGEWSLELADG